MNKAIDTINMDPSVNPQVDFYAFVNGGWLNRTEIPPDRSSWGSFHELALSTDHKMLAILENELAIPGPAENIAARVFESGMDDASREKTGIKPLNELLQTIDQIDNQAQLPSVLGKLLKADFGGLFQFSVHPDLGHSKRYAAYMESGALGLPERSYYVDEDDKTREIQGRYTKYIAKILQTYSPIPVHTIQSISLEVLHFEQKLAEHTLPKEDRRDIAKIYNVFTFDKLKEQYPSWDWDQFFTALGIDPPKQIIVTDPAFFQFVNDTIRTFSLDTIKHYLLFQLIHQAAPFANKALEEEHFDMFSRTLEGIQTMRPQKERVVQVINGLMGEALGELFVSKHFPPAAKQTALEMVQDIIAAYKNRIAQLTWMQVETKTRALEKIEAMKIKIGYPDEWKSYAGLDIQSAEDGGSFLSNIMAAAAWKKKQDTDRIDQEADREEWFMAPQVVNAYYNPVFNEIVFPAAILQPPFFDWEADAAINYGGIGAVIGHEMTHGFDDQGSRFDKEGNYNEWWTAEDREAFQQHTQKLIQQFDAYFPFEDLSLNGTFTLGENIADLGGLSVAFDALQLYYDRHGRPDHIGSFTPQQAFFISWATVWRNKIRPEALRNRIKTDPHAPAKYRAVAAPSNLDSFYTAFDIRPESPWYRKEEDRIKIW